MSSLAVVCLGIGAMVGAGVFSLMGQVALVAGQAVWLSFFLGGVVAVFSGLAFGRLGARYPTSGGMLDYFNEAFRPGVLAGGLSLVYLVTLLLSVALVGQALGRMHAPFCCSSGCRHRRQHGSRWVSLCCWVG